MGTVFIKSKDVTEKELMGKILRGKGENYPDVCGKSLGRGMVEDVV